MFCHAGGAPLPHPRPPRPTLQCPTPQCPRRAAGREWWSDQEIDVCALNCPNCNPCRHSQCNVNIQRPGEGSGRDPRATKCFSTEGCRWGDKVYAGSAEGIEHNFVEGGRQCFWDGREDPQRNAERVAALEAMFHRKSPTVRPADIPGPACGW